MKQPIYKVYMARPREAWYRLSEDERTKLLGKLQEKRTAVGGRTVVSANSSWSSDRWQFFGVEEFPDMDAVEEYHAFLVEIDWLRYIEGHTALGTKMD